MKHFFFLLLLLFPVIAFSQDPFPTNPRKLQLGYQTTGEGILSYGTGVPGYTPTQLRSAFHYMDTTNNVLYQYNRIETKWDTIHGGSLTSEFDGDRPILRVPTAGTNIGSTTVTEWLDWWYFTAPTIALTTSPTSKVIEVGDSVVYTFNTNVTNSAGATLSSGEFRRTSPAAAVVTSFGASTSDATAINFSPKEPEGAAADYDEQVYTFRSFQDYAGAEIGTAQSSTVTLQGVFPVLYGMSSTDFSTTGDFYSALTKLVQTEGDKTVTLTGSGFIYYAIPASWSDNTINQIIDHNGFNVTASFTVYDRNVSSSGLTNDWTNVPYKLYKLNNLTTTSGYAYQFNQ